MIRLLFTLFRRFASDEPGSIGKVTLAALATVAFSASGFLYFEQPTRPDLDWSDAVWWAFVTMTTVGYGDYFPETTMGRYLIAFPTMLFGISVLGYVLSTVATSLLEARSKELRGMTQARLRDHVIILHYPGLGRVTALLDELAADDKTRGRPVVLLDPELEELPPELAGRGVTFVHGDPVKAAVLDRAAATTARYAIVLARDPMDGMSDNHTLAAVLTLEQHSPQIHSVAECIDPERVELLARSGADSVVCLSELSSNLLVQEAVDPGVQRVLKQITSNTHGQQIYLVDIRALPEWTYACACRLLGEQGAMPIGLERGSDVWLNAKPEHTVKAGDRLVCIAATRPTALG